MQYICLLIQAIILFMLNFQTACQLHFQKENRNLKGDPMIILQNQQLYSDSVADSKEKLYSFTINNKQDIGILVFTKRPLSSRFSIKIRVENDYYDLNKIFPSKEYFIISEYFLRQQTIQYLNYINEYVIQFICHYDQHPTLEGDDCSYEFTFYIKSNFHFYYSLSNWHNQIDLFDDEYNSESYQQQLVAFVSTGEMTQSIRGALNVRYQQVFILEKKATHNELLDILLEKRDLYNNTDEFQMVDSLNNHQITTEIQPQVPISLYIIKSNEINNQHQCTLNLYSRNSTILLNEYIFLTEYNRKFVDIIKPSETQEFRLANQDIEQIITIFVLSNTSSIQAALISQNEKFISYQEVNNQAPFLIHFNPSNKSFNQINRFKISPHKSSHTSVQYQIIVISKLDYPKCYFTSTFGIPIEYQIEPGQFVQQNFFCSQQNEYILDYRINIFYPQQIESLSITVKQLDSNIYTKIYSKQQEENPLTQDQSNDLRILTDINNTFLSEDEDADQFIIKEIRSQSYLFFSLNIKQMGFYSLIIEKGEDIQQDNDESEQEDVSNSKKKNNLVIFITDQNNIHSLIPSPVILKEVQWNKQLAQNNKKYIDVYIFMNTEMINLFIEKKACYYPYKLLISNNLFELLDEKYLTSIQQSSLIKYYDMTPLYVVVKPMEQLINENFFFEIKISQLSLQDQNPLEMFYFDNSDSLKVEENNASLIIYFKKLKSNIANIGNHTAIEPVNYNYKLYLSNQESTLKQCSVQFANPGAMIILSEKQHKNISQFEFEIIKPDYMDFYVVVIASVEIINRDTQMRYTYDYSTEIFSIFKKEISIQEEIKQGPLLIWIIIFMITILFCSIIYYFCMKRCKNSTHYNGNLEVRHIELISDQNKTGQVTV